MNVIELSHLEKRYQDFTLRDLSLSVAEGSICGLVGENGAGKSTTIRLLLGAIRRDGGEARVLGCDPASPAFREIKEDIGVVLDEVCFPEVLNAVEVERVLKSAYRNWETETFHALFQRFDLPEKKPLKDYSRGMRMKLAIAAAMSHRPRLLVLDEATAGLDPIARDDVLDLFYDFTRQADHSILISSHILSDLEKLCDTIAFLHKGQLLFCEEKDRLLERYGIFHGTEEQAARIPPEAVSGRNSSQYGGVRVLVDRDRLASGALSGVTLERPSVEDVILFLARGVRIH